MAVMIRWIPWTLVAVALGLFLVIPSGVLLAVGWLIVFAIERSIVLTVRARSARMLIGSLLVVLCFLAAFEGGWYLIPAALAFLAVDAVRLYRAPAT